MKTTILLSILGAAICLSSCHHKEYTCHCDGGLQGGANITIKEPSKSKAEKACDDYNAADGGAADGYFNCKLN
ncbi:MAG: hypothetical protein V4561_06320 [Bacteroidota bacterium]